VVHNYPVPGRRSGRMFRRDTYRLGFLCHSKCDGINRGGRTKLEGRVRRRGRDTGKTRRKKQMPKRMHSRGRGTLCCVGTIFLSHDCRTGCIDHPENVKGGSKWMRIDLNTERSKTEGASKRGEKKNHSSIENCSPGCATSWSFPQTSTGPAGEMATSRLTVPEGKGSMKQRGKGGYFSSSCRCIGNHAKIAGERAFAGKK